MATPEYNTHPVPDPNAFLPPACLPVTHVVDTRDLMTWAITSHLFLLCPAVTLQCIHIRTRCGCQRLFDHTISCRFPTNAQGSTPA